ncbi:MAG: hypothetical protein U1F67_22230 [Rubrivivax sp.]
MHAAPDAPEHDAGPPQADWRAEPAEPNEPDEPAEPGRAGREPDEPGEVTQWLRQLGEANPQASSRLFVSRG